MKRVILFLVLFCTLFSYSQSSYSPSLAADLMALNNSFTFKKIFNSDSAIIPNTYKRIYTSGIIGLDNQYQIWQKGRVGVISFRGSTTDKSSWVENLYSAMIPSTGKIILPGSITVKYSFAKDTAAHIHAGWTLGLIFMVDDLKYHIRNLNREGVYTIILTGHSQGGALAHLCRAYLENLKKGELSSKNKYITYAFASPMVGNKVFAKEYNQRYADMQSSFSIVNPKDMVPLLPVTLYNGKLFDPNEISDLLLNGSSNIAGVFAMRLVSKWFIKDPDAYYIQKAGYDMEDEIKKKVGEVKMPKYCRDQSYTILQNRILLGPFEDLVQELKKDSINVDSLSEIPFYGNNMKIQSGSMVQHKPFNYYLYLLKENAPQQYALRRKQFRIIH